MLNEKKLYGKYVNGIINNYSNFILELKSCKKKVYIE